MYTVRIDTDRQTASLLPFFSLFHLQYTAKGLHVVVHIWIRKTAPHFED